MKNIELGDLVEDVITGFRGIVVIEYRYLYSQPRYLVQPQCEVSFGMPNAVEFDIPQLIIIEKAKVVIPMTGLGVVK